MSNEQIVTQPSDVRVYRFWPDNSEPNRGQLDLVTVYVEQYLPTSGRMTVQCYEQAWTAYWVGAHGDKGLESFVCAANSDYIVDGLTCGQGGLLRKDQEKRQRIYLLRIVKAIQAEFAKVAQS